jgi:hypothetical protein
LPSRRNHCIQDRTSVQEVDGRLERDPDEAAAGCDDPGFWSQMGRVWLFCGEEETRENPFI